MRHRKAAAVAGGLLVVGLGVFGYSRATSQDKDPETAPPRLYHGPEPFIPGGQQYGQQATIPTASTAFVGVPNPVTINNTTGQTKKVLLRWTGVIGHFSLLGWAYVAPMRDGVALPATPGPYFIGYDLDGDAVVSDTFGVQWVVDIGPGSHTFQPAMRSNDGSTRQINGYHFSAEMKTK